MDEHIAYRWLSHGVAISHHTLLSFRVGHAAKLDRLLTQAVAALVSEGLVTMERVAQDGVNVRAAAGAASVHRQTTLVEALAEAEARVMQHGDGGFRPSVNVHWPRTPIVR